MAVATAARLGGMTTGSGLSSREHGQMDMEDIADELYDLHPRDFTATRDNRAREARERGDRQLAEAIKKLRRPTVAAWLANLLVRQRPAQIGSLFKVGSDMRHAQQQLDSGQLRRLATERHDLIAALRRCGSDAAAEHGQEASDTALDELESTLEAAVADEDAAQALREGRLTSALHYTGFGPVDLSEAVGYRSSTGRGGETAPTKKGGAASQRSSAGSEREVREAQLALRAAERSAEQQRRRVDELRDTRQRRHKEVEDLEKRVKQLRASLAESERALAEAERALDEKAEDLKSARRQEAEARSAVGRRTPSGS